MTSGVGSPDVAAFIRVKAGTTIITQSPDVKIANTGAVPRARCTGLYTATSTAAVTFNVTAGRSIGSSIFDVSGSADHPFVFLLRAVGPSSLLLTS